MTGEITDKIAKTVYLSKDVVFEFWESGFIFILDTSNDASIVVRAGEDSKRLFAAIEQIKDKIRHSEN